jgi:AAHS family benzoate transporter-like MFS transporter
MLLLALTGIGLSLMPLVADQLRADFGYSDSQIGFLTSVFMLALGVASIPWGLASARWGGQTLAFGLAVGVVGSLVFAFGTSYGAFVAGRLVQGVGLGVIVPTVGTVIADSVASCFRGRAYGIFGTGHGMGVMLALLILPSIAEAAGYRGVFLTTAGLIALFGIIAVVQAPVRWKPAQDALAFGPRAMARALGTAVTNRQVLLLCLFNLAGLAVGVGALVWTPLFLRAEFGASSHVAAYLTAGLGLAQLIGNPLGALAMGRWGKRPVIVTSMLAMTLCSALVPFLPGLWLVFVLVTVTGFLTLAYFPPLLGGIAEVVKKPQEVGAATGLLEVFGFTGALIAPWCFGMLLDAGGETSGYTAGYLMLAAIAAISSFGLLLLRLPAARAQRPTAAPIPVGTEGRSE